MDSETEQAEADRIAQRVLTEVVIDLKTLSTGTRSNVASAENPCKIRRDIAILPCHHGAWLRLNAHSFVYPIVPHKNIDSLYLSNKHRGHRSPCLITPFCICLLPAQRGASLSGFIGQAPATAIPNSFDRSDHGQELGLLIWPNLTFGHWQCASAISGRCADLSLPLGKRCTMKGIWGNQQWQTRSTYSRLQM